MTEGTHISLEDLALYATQSLSAEESSAIRTHLSGCALCQSELAEISGDLGLLALSVDQHPLPEGARQRFLARVAAEPAAGKRNIPQEQRSNPSAVIPVVPMPRRRGSAVWVPWGVAAALAIVAVALGLQNHSMNDELRSESNMVTNLAAMASRAQQVLEILSSPSAQRIVLTPGKAPLEPSGRASYLADRGGLLFTANNLNPLPADKAYELWLIPANGKAPMPAGVFRPDATGSASVVLPPLPAGVPAKAFGVTVENASGSNAPTSPIILSGAAPGV